MLRHHIESDVAIIGAGPAGATAAIFLSRLGYSVTILERQHVRRPSFGETLPRAAEHVLRQADVWAEFTRAQNPTWTRHVSAWGDTELKFQDLHFQSSGPGWFIDRESFDAILRGRATSYGCSILGDTAIRSCERVQSRWHLQFTREKEECSLLARFLIDAAGRVSPIWHRPFTGRTVTDNTITTAFVFPRDASENYTLVETVPHGWFYSASAHRQFVVLFMTDPDLHRSLPALAAEQLKEAPHTRKRLGELLPGPARIVQLAAGSSVRNRVATDNWVAVGDARMTLDPLSSAGILSALRSGHDAAQFVSGIDGGIQHAVHRYREQTMKTYERYLRERKFYYGCERRWLSSPFWLRRATPPDPHASEVTAGINRTSATL